MFKAAVLGYPISHSLSPKLHGYWLNQYHIHGHYQAIECQPAQLQETLKRLESEGYRGVNLTVPLKENILPLLDDISPQASQIGAVNTLLFRSGKWCGKNTDAFGFMENLRSQVKNLEPYLTHAVVLGAGGAARAVISGLLAAGCARITVLNRTGKKAEILAQMDSSIEVQPWESRGEVIAAASLLVNTTSLGMVKMPPLELSLAAFPSSALVTDIVYNPLQTDLLKAAAKKGCATVDGLGMLIYQAVPAFEHFYGRKPEVTDQLREQLL